MNYFAPLVFSSHWKNSQALKPTHVSCNDHGQAENTTSKHLKLQKKKIYENFFPPIVYKSSFLHSLCNNYQLLS